jgi:ABC-type bacteriocin/lantibiotic exporter with double-glycine peptidase domain
MSAFLIIAFVLWNFCSKCYKPSYSREDSFDTAQETIQDILYNLLSVYSNQTEKQEKKNVDIVNEETNRTSRNYIRCGIPYYITFAIIFLGLFVGITWTGIYLYKQNMIKLPILVSSFMVTFSILKTCMSFYHDFESFIYFYGGIKVVSDYLDNLPTPCKKGTALIPNISKGIDIKFKNVIFYPGENTTKPLFYDLNLRIPAKQKIAIMGGIGSGKTSLAQLLMRLRCHTKGDVLLNNTPNTNIKITEIRKYIQYVPQHPRLFDRTLWKNLSYGNPSLQLKNVYDIVQELQLSDFEILLKDKMFDSVGKQGSNLSGGQRQLVWLMRAFFSKSEIIILDEPTASLDKKSREQVLKVIEKISTNRTLILITHDSDTLSITDRVIRMDKGEIIEDVATDKKFHILGR